MSKIFQPVIKWSGSKRSQCRELIKYFPKTVGTYYEPFCGGASVMRALMEDNSFHIDKYIISDNNKELIELWNIIRSDPSIVADHYERLWKELNRDDDKARKKDFYGHIRKRFNDSRDPLDLMFIMRTTTNGMPRYNSNGGFNNSFHITRNGITPDKLRGISAEWHKLLNNFDVVFKCCDYTEIRPEENDFIYMDPPYFHSKGMYGNTVSPDRLFGYIRNVKCKYALSYDGISGKTDNTYNVPDDIYKVHIYVKSGNSSFKRIKGSDKDAVVYESLYLNY